MWGLTILKLTNEFMVFVQKPRTVICIWRDFRNHNCNQIAGADDNESKFSSTMLLGGGGMFLFNLRPLKSLAKVVEIHSYI